MQKRIATSRGRIRFALNSWTQASFWKTPKRERAGKGNRTMKIETKAIHVGDRKADPAKPGAFIPVTTPIYTAASSIYESTAKLDRVLAPAQEGFSYPPSHNPPI